MNRYRNWIKVGLLCFAVTLVLPGCKSSKTDSTVREHTISECDLPDCPVHGKKVIIKAPPAPPPPAPKPAPSGDGWVRSHLMFPSAVKNADGSDCCGKIKLERLAPAEVSVGQEYEYIIKAHNLGDTGVRDVAVVDEIPDGFEMTGSAPDAAGREGNRVTWDLGTIMPGESKTITVKGKAVRPGDVTVCASVTYTPFVCVTTRVIQPALRLTKSMPSEALLCDPIPVKLVVTNTGSGTARNVKIVDNLPDGLRTEDSRMSVNINVGDLASGQSKEYALNLKPVNTGSFKNTARASADGGLTAEASSGTTVREPVLAISKTGPGKAYIGGHVTYEITVSNEGDAAAANTVVTDVIGNGATFVGASDGGTFAGGRVTWNLGTLPVDGSRKLSVTVNPTGQGRICNTSSANARCAKAVTAEACTEIVGIPAILLEVIDVNDPVQVGTNVTYEITVTNQGSATGHDIKIVSTLEEPMEFVSTSGPTRGVHAGGVVTFDALPSLAPKAKATWRLTVKAVQSGDVRLGLKMTEQRLTRPVEETEATNFYE